MPPSPSHFIILGYLCAVEMKQKILDVLCTALLFAVCGIDTDIEAQTRKIRLSQAKFNCKGDV